MKHFTNKEINKDVVVIVSHYLSDRIVDMFKTISKEFSNFGDVFLLVNDDTKAFLPLVKNDRITTFTTSQIFNNKYTPFTNSIVPGSNHLILLWFYAMHPEYRYYWNIEYDVFFNGDWELLFNSFVKNEVDFISSHIYKYIEDEDWYWWEAYIGATLNISLENRLRSFNPIYRISNRALKLLDRVLKDGNRGHHEVLIPSVLNYFNYTIEDFGGIGSFTRPSNKEKFYLQASGISTMRFRPVFNLNENFEYKNVLYHPVKE